jgi:hypothetical protein
MVESRTATALAGLAVSVAVSLVLWVVFDVAAVFLVVPFVPLLARRLRRPRRTCPECGFRTRDRDANYCPRDGTELE